MTTKTRPTAADTDACRDTLRRLLRQIEFLRRKRDAGREPRFNLLSAIASGIAAMSNLCDQPGGYTDPEDPFAPDALGILRSEFAELRAGDYPVPAGVPIMPNGKRDHAERKATGGLL